MAAKEEKEKAKFVRESVVKYFFDMSKSTFTVMVLGGLAALFGIVETDRVDSYWAIFWGCVFDCHFICDWIINF